ncbi:uncharacterized protein Dvir_GJ15852 [Drosophila virilis]|uniref:Uncharacterized protein n=1 Tax=Drosophila virilis TaxID=7244 RepID=B4MA70_DROVI|nr:uncharacterized protein Dvir_GJ15852 [Drosophila virilis]
MISMIIRNMLRIVDWNMIIIMDLVRAICWYHMQLFDSAHVPGFNLTELMIQHILDVKKGLAVHYIEGPNRNRTELSTCRE